MNLLVLSKSRAVPSTRRLCEVAAARGHSAIVENPAKLALILGAPKGPRLQQGARRVAEPDVVIPRLAPDGVSHTLAVLEHLAMAGAVTINSARAIGQSRNPARCLERLAVSGLGVPATVFARAPAQLKRLVERVGGVPVLVRLLDAQGKGSVMVCESPQSLEAALEAIIGLGHDVVMQEYVRKAGRDVRVVVVGGKALGAVARVPKPGRLSRTLSRIARLEATPLNDACREAAEASARVCELDFCAVDMLETPKGAKVYEVVASPALPELEAVTQLDLAREIIQHAERCLQRSQEKHA